MSDNKITEAFETYLRDPVVQRALEMRMTSGKLSVDLLRDCFMNGAKCAADLLVKQKTEARRS